MSFPRYSKFCKGSRTSGENKLININEPEYGNEQHAQLLADFDAY